MAEKFRSLIKLVTNRINTHQLFNNATTRINNATGRVQEKFNNVQNAVAAKYDVVSKQINKDITVMQNLNAPQLEPSLLPKKVLKWWQWYQQLTGLDTVELAKQQVITAQDKLFKCQDNRRHLNRQATLINNKLKEVYSELIQTKRDDPKYVQLTIIENKSLQDQAKIVSQLDLLEKEEKDHFTLLATAIKEYHDSQTMNAQKYKYLSILASAVLAIISLIGSMTYNYSKIISIRNVIAEAQQRNESVVENNLNTLENNMNRLFSEVIKRLDNNNSNEQKINVVTKELNTNTLKEMQTTYIVLGLCFVGLYTIAKMLIG
ncbi:mitochondrial potassium channel [Osmia lignaria lignaria]|uniref:mitochondrial potassium channel n=1 Tax=Osmia lignaria lignaria TaxID=1437193 RepID=UPI00402BC9F0